MIAGETLPLSCKLGDQAADKYVRAYVRDELGAEIAGSPAALGHVGEGIYKSSALIMPSSVEFLTVAYVVYDDAGYSAPSEDYQDGTDVFVYGLSTDTIIEKLNQIIAQLNAIQGTSTGPDLVGKISIDATALAGVINDLETLRGEISTNETISGAIEDDSRQLNGIIEDDGLTGEVDV